MISIQDYYDNHGNIIHGNHGNGTQSNKDYEVFKKHRVNDQFFTLLSSMVDTYYWNWADRDEHETK